MIFGGFIASIPKKKVWGGHSVKGFRVWADGENKHLHQKQGNQSVTTVHSKEMSIGLIASMKPSKA